MGQRKKRLFRKKSRFGCLAALSGRAVFTQTDEKENRRQKEETEERADDSKHQKGDSRFLVVFPIKRIVVDHH